MVLWLNSRIVVNFKKQTNKNCISTESARIGFKPALTSFQLQIHLWEGRWVTARTDPQFKRHWCRQQDRKAQKSLVLLRSQAAQLQKSSENVIFWLSCRDPKPLWPAVKGWGGRRGRRARRWSCRQARLSQEELSKLRTTPGFRKMCCTPGTCSTQRMVCFLNCCN